MTPRAHPAALLAHIALPLLFFLCACSTLPPPDPRLGALPPDAVRLRTIPLPPADLRHDRALLSAFFAANGAPISPDECAQILDHPLTPGRMSPHAFVHAAHRHDRIPVSFDADALRLADALRSRRLLLLYLPASPPASALPELVVPVAFSPSPPATVWLLRGDASVSPLPADDFFARRSPLHQSALSLVPPSGLPAFARDTGQKQPSPSQELLLADFWFAHGDFRRAADSYASLLDASPDDDPAFSPLSALLGRADSLVNLRQFSQAIPLYRQALERDPQNPRILNNLAYALMLENKNAFEALSFANRARELDPSNPLVLETVGSLNLRIGDYETAARTLELAWARALKHPPEVQITIMDQLVRAWLGCGRPHLAYQVAEHRRRTFPDSKLPPDILAQFPSLRHPPPPPTPLPLHP